MAAGARACLLGQGSGAANQVGPQTPLPPSAECGLAEPLVRRAFGRRRPLARPNKRRPAPGNRGKQGEQSMRFGIRRVEAPSASSGSPPSQDARPPTQSHPRAAIRAHTSLSHTSVQALHARPTTTCARTRAPSRVRAALCSRCLLSPILAASPRAVASSWPFLPGGSAREPS